MTSIPLSHQTKDLPLSMATGALQVVTGPQIRQSLLSASPAFLTPERFTPAEALTAALSVLFAFARGSTTAAKLVFIRQTTDPGWPRLARHEAIDYMVTLRELYKAMS